MKRTDSAAAQLAAEDPAWVEHIAKKLENFGDAAGQHGPLDACTKRITVRLASRRFTEISLLARGIGAKPAPFVTQLCTVVADCPPKNWHRAISAFQEAARGLRG